MPMKPHDRLDYPKYDKNQWRSRKIPFEDIGVIRNRYANGEWIRNIAKDYGVHYDTIYKVINEDYRKRQQDKSMRRHKDRYETNEDYRKSVLAINKLCRNRKKEDCPTFSKWKSQQDKKCHFWNKEESKEKRRIKAKEDYYKNIERRRKTSREYYHKKKALKMIETN